MRTWGLAGVFGPMLLAAAGMLIAAVGVSAQAYWQPQPAPLVSAESQAWFRLGEPVAYEGYVYYPAGARVFFDGNVMVRAGALRGIPIYIDTTIEAFSRIFIPAGGGVLQPYERRRTGDAAGTTGSRAPSFPVSIAGEVSNEPSLVGTLGPGEAREHTPHIPPAAPESGISSVPTATPPQDVIEAGLRPKGLNEVYVNYAGYRWRAAGRAEPMSDARFSQIGRSGHFPVFADRNETRAPRTIYLPSRPGLLARYERAGTTPRY